MSSLANENTNTYLRVLFQKLNVTQCQAHSLGQGSCAESEIKGAEIGVELSDVPW